MVVRRVTIIQQRGMILQREEYMLATTWSQGRMGSGAPVEGWPWIKNSSSRVRGMKTEHMGTNASRSPLLVAK